MVKVGDFGLTEDMYGTNYYRRRKSEAVNERVPIRWMAPESIVEDIYNEKTDVVCMNRTLLNPELQQFIIIHNISSILLYVVHSSGHSE